jgi:hypothetical protein
MRVLIATDSYRIGGNWTFLESIVESLTKRNIETTMYYGSDDAGQLMFDHFEKNNLMVTKDIHPYYDYGFFTQSISLEKCIREKINIGRYFQFLLCVKPSDRNRRFGHPIQTYYTNSQEIKQLYTNPNDDVLLLPFGINHEKFTFSESNNQCKNIYSLSQSEELNTFLKNFCRNHNFNFEYNHNRINPTFNISEKIKRSDLIIGAGRSVYEAMASGKNVICGDYRDYYKHWGRAPYPIMDGMVLEENIEELLNFNCSGRCYRKEITEDSLLSEIEKYSLDNGIFNHNFAKRYLDIDKVVDRFMFG